MTHQINLNQICSIKTYTAAFCKEYVYVKSTHSWYRRLFNLGPTKSGFANIIERAFGSYKLYSVDELLEYDDTIVIDPENDVLYKPHADIRTADGKKSTKYFSNTGELSAFVDTIKGSNPYITIS